MPTVQEVWQDPDFHKLPPTEKAKVMQAIDSDFAALPMGEQNKVVFQLSNRNMSGQTAVYSDGRQTEIAKGAQMTPPEASTYAANRAAFAQEGGVSTFGGTKGGDTRKISYTDSGYKPNEKPRNLKDLAKNAVQNVVELPMAPVQIFSSLANAPDTGKAVLDIAKAPLGFVPYVAEPVTGKTALENWGENPVYGAMTLSALGEGIGALRGKSAPAPPVAKGGGLAEAAATKLYDMTLKQGTTLKPSIRKQNVKTGLEGGYLPNARGVDRLAADISKTENEIGAGIKAGKAAEVTGTLDRAMQNVESLREEANRSADPVKNNALIDAELERLRGNPLQGENNGISIADIQKMKVEQGRHVKYQAKTGQAVDAFQASIDKARIRGLKEELESQLADVFPELKATNQKLGNMYKLQDVLERAASRIENNQGIGIGLPIKGGAGATIGGMIGGAPGAAIGGGIGTLIGVIEHPAVAPRLAMALYKASKGKMTMAEATTAANGRLDMLKNKLKDQRGLVGKDIDAETFRANAIKQREDAMAEYVKQLDKERPVQATGDVAVNPVKMVIPSVTLDQIPIILQHSGFDAATQQAVVNHLKAVVNYGNKLLAKHGKKPDKNPIFGKKEIQDAIDALGVQGQSGAMLK